MYSDLSLDDGPISTGGPLEKLPGFSRTRCSQLKSLPEEYYIVSLLDAFIRQKQVSPAH